MQDHDWRELYRAEGVVLGEFQWKDLGSKTLVVGDEVFRHYRITFSAEGECCYVGISAEWSDRKPGELANFTPVYESVGGQIAAKDISITDGGLLSALARKDSASHVDIRVGFTVQLPVAYVEPIRRAIALLQAGWPAKET